MLPLSLCYHGEWSQIAGRSWQASFTPPSPQSHQCLSSRIQQTTAPTRSVCARRFVLLLSLSTLLLPPCSRRLLTMACCQTGHAGQRPSVLPNGKVTDSCECSKAGRCHSCECRGREKGGAHRTVTRNTLWPVGGVTIRELLKTAKSSNWCSHGFMYCKCRSLPPSLLPFTIVPSYPTVEWWVAGGIGNGLYRYVLYLRAYLWACCVFFFNSVGVDVYYVCFCMYIMYVSACILR